MRELTGHHVNEVNKGIVLKALDDPETHHDYYIGVADIRDREPRVEYFLHFQKGSIEEFGINGITNEVLIEIAIDRLHVFQLGEYPCHENEMALAALRQARMKLKDRSDRITRETRDAQAKE